MCRSTFIPIAIAALLLAACGDTGSNASDGDDATRTVEIDMVDIAFEPDTLDVKRGETVRFVFTNTGKAVHDAFVGDRVAQADHEPEMRDEEGDEHGGGHEDGDEDAITVDPGDSGELTYTFDDAGTIEIGCHQEGHYESGMKVEVEVA
jgi:uncharacterized cupredoxin-like copper-binding protein